MSEQQKILIARLSKVAMQKLIDGKLKQKANCLVKFYSNRCPYCHMLKPVYHELAHENTGLHFFVFNIADYAPESLETILNFKGVPNIVLFRKEEEEGVRIEVMPDPEVFDSKTIYSKEYIQDFIYENVPVQIEVEPISLEEGDIKGPMPRPSLRQPGFKLVDDPSEASYERYQRLIREKREERQRQRRNKNTSGGASGPAKGTSK